MSLGILAEAILRVEHKLDQLLKFLKVPNTMMHFVGQSCPTCSKTIDYQVDLTHCVVFRRCGCSTGKQPPSTPLFPVSGAKNGNSST